MYVQTLRCVGGVSPADVYKLVVKLLLCLVMYVSYVYSHTESQCGPHLLSRVYVQTNWRALLLSSNRSRPVSDSGAPPTCTSTPPSCLDLVITKFLVEILVPFDLRA